MPRARRKYEVKDFHVQLPKDVYEELDKLYCQHYGKLWRYKWEMVKKLVEFFKENYRELEIPSI